MAEFPLLAVGRGPPRGSVSLGDPAARDDEPGVAARGRLRPYRRRFGDHIGASLADHVAQVLRGGDRRGRSRVGLLGGVSCCSWSACPGIAASSVARPDPWSGSLACDHDAAAMCTFRQLAAALQYTWAEAGVGPALTFVWAGRHGARMTIELGRSADSLGTLKGHGASRGTSGTGALLSSSRPGGTARLPQLPYIARWWRSGDRPGSRNPADLGAALCSLRCSSSCCHARPAGAKSSLARAVRGVRDVRDRRPRPDR